MKNTNLTRAAASLLACGMVFGLTACSSSASSSEATAESAASSEAASEALFLTTLPQKAPPMIILIWLIFLSVMPMTRTDT